MLWSEVAPVRGAPVRRSGCSGCLVRGGSGQRWIRSEVPPVKRWLWLEVPKSKGVLQSEVLEAEVLWLEGSCRGSYEGASGRSLSPKT